MQATSYIYTLEDLNKLPEEEIHNALNQFVIAAELMSWKDRYALVISSRSLPVRGIEDKSYRWLATFSANSGIPYSTLKAMVLTCL